MRHVRSVAAVAVGYLVKGVFVGIFFVFSGWHAEESPSDQSVWLAMFWRAFAAVVAGYLTGLVAGRREYRHALAVAVLSGIVSVGSMLAGAGGKEPIWAQLMNLTLMVPLLLLGAHLRRRHQEFATEPENEPRPRS